MQRLNAKLNSHELLRMANAIESYTPHHPPFPDRPSPAPSHPPFASEGEVLLPGIHHVQIDSDIRFNGSTFHEYTLTGIVARGFVVLFVGLMLLAFYCRNNNRENRSFWLTMMHRANKEEMYARDMQKRLAAMEENKRKRIIKNAVHEEWKRHVKERRSSEQLARGACERQRVERERLKAELEGAKDGTPNGKGKSLVYLDCEATADADPGGAAGSATCPTGGASEAAVDGSSRRSSARSSVGDFFDVERNIESAVGTIKDGKVRDAALFAYDIVALNTGKKFKSLDEMVLDEIGSPRQSYRRQSLNSRQQMYKPGSSSVEWGEDADADIRRMAEKTLAVEREMIERGLEKTTISDKLEVIRSGDSTRVEYYEM